MTCPVPVLHSQQNLYGPSALYYLLGMQYSRHSSAFSGAAGLCAGDFPGSQPVGPGSPAFEV
jgi:hypothetical protein